MKSTFLSFFAGLIVLNAQNPNAFSVQVETDKGTIEGSYDTHTGVQTYLGVPFAKPPVGNLRWKAPVEMQNWEPGEKTPTQLCPAEGRQKGEEWWKQVAWLGQKLTERLLRLAGTASGQRVEGAGVALGAA